MPTGRIASRGYTEVGSLRIPTGSASVTGPPFDFRQPNVIESRLREAHTQLVASHGHDQNWFFDHPLDGELHLAATPENPLYVRKMETRATEPAL